MRRFVSDLFEAWKKRGRNSGGKNQSLLITLSGITAAAIVVVQLFGAQTIGSSDMPTGDAALREGLIHTYRQGARPALVNRRIREMNVLEPNQERRALAVRTYANALIRARKIAQNAGRTYPSNDLIGAIADALLAGGVEEDILVLMERGRGRETLVLSRYYVFVRRGERSRAAAVMALRE